MFFDSDRGSLRRFFIDAWRKQIRGASLEPLEQMLARIVAEHPEYHALLEDDAAVESDFDLSRGQVNTLMSRNAAGAAIRLQQRREACNGENKNAP